MLYQFLDEIDSIEINELNDKILTAGLVSVQELEKINKNLGLPATIIEMCKSSEDSYSYVELYDNCTFIKLGLIEVEHLDKNLSSVGLVIKKNLMLVVNCSDNGKIINYFMKAISRYGCESASLERIVFSFLEGMISSDNRVVEELEDRIDLLEESILQDDELDEEFTDELMELKRMLLGVRSFYEQLIDISEALRSNDNGIFEAGSLNLFKMLTGKATRLKNNFDLLRDNVAHLWDSYQAYMDGRLNQTMKAFTIVTTIFFPLTVIVGWYGMNFKYMPELNSKFGYPGVIAFSILVVIGFIVWFKKRKWI